MNERKDASPEAPAGEATFEDLGLDVSLPPSGLVVRGGQAAREAVAQALGLASFEDVNVETVLVKDRALWLRVGGREPTLPLCVAPIAALPRTPRAIVWKRASRLALGTPAPVDSAFAGAAEAILPSLDEVVFSDLLRAVGSDPDPSGMGPDADWLSQATSFGPAVEGLPNIPRGEVLSADPHACREIAAALGLDPTEVSAAFLFENRVWVRVDAAEGTYAIVFGPAGLEPPLTGRFDRRRVGDIELAWVAPEAASTVRLDTVATALGQAELASFLAHVSEHPDPSRPVKDLAWAREVLAPPRRRGPGGRLLFRARR